MPSTRRQFETFQTKFDAMVSIQDRGFNFSDGVYEVMSFSDYNLINLSRLFLPGILKHPKGLPIEV